MIGRQIVHGIYPAATGCLSALARLTNSTAKYGRISAAHRVIHSTSCLRQKESISSNQQMATSNVDFEIVKASEISNNPIKSFGIKQESNVELDDIQLNLTTGERLILNLTWLRDSCHCNRCTHQFSRQRLFTPKEFRKEMFAIERVHLSQGDNSQGPLATSSPLPSGQRPPANNKVYIKWVDGHESSYSLDWLRSIDKLYGKSELQLDGTFRRSNFAFPQDDFYAPTKDNSPRPEFWNMSQMSAKMEPVCFQDLVDGFKFNNDDATFINANKISDMSRERFGAMWSLAHQLVTFGLAKIVQVPQERNQVLKVARSLAYERPTGYGTVFDVVVEPSVEINLAYSSLEFDLHSDLCYRETSPGVQLLHCIRNSTEGGLSYFSDSFNAAELLRDTHPELFEVLVQFPATFVVRDPYRNIKFRRQQPVISLDYQGELSDVYYSPFMLPPVGFRSDVKLFYFALDKFTQLLQSKENKIVTKMDPGDLFIFQNRRVLHGRSAYNATTSSRFLQGCYMDWDEIKCLYEKLHAHKIGN